MLSLRNFLDLFWHFDRVYKQFEVSRGVKSKKLSRAELNKSWRDFLVPWHDFLGRETCFWEDQIVTRFPVSWCDFEKDLEHELGFKTNRGAIHSNRGAILASENISYLNRSWFQKQGLRFEKSKVQFWDLRTGRRAISSTFFQFMYVLIPLLIMLFVSLIMRS